jgi:uncharacterized protein YukE
VSILGDIQELWHIVGEVWNCGDIAGDAGVLRGHASHWRQMHAELQSLSNDLQASVTRNLVGGSDGNWNDQAGESFQTVWTQTRQQLDDLAGQFDQVATQIDQFAGQVDNFNDNFHTCLVVLGASLAVMAVATWIPVVGEVVDGAELAVDAVEVEQAWSLINALKTILVLLRSNLVKSFLFSLGKNFALNFSINWGSRIVERGIMLGDPTEGWSRFDRNQLLLATGVATAVSMVIPMTALGRWAALPTTRATGALPWGQFAKASTLRMGQMLAVANGYNLVNHMLVQGQGLKFDIPGTVGIGSLSTGIPALLIIGGNAVWFVASRGTSVLPTTLTSPTLVAVNTVSDVMIPGVSPAVRDARGLVYATAGGQLPPAAVQALQDNTGMIARLPQRIVKPGDTLWDIAVQQYGQDAGLKYWDVVRRNHIQDPNLIQPGEVIVLPPVTPPPPAVHTTSVTPPGRMRVA